MHDAVPVVPVVPVQVSVPFRVKVTGSPGTGAAVALSVRTAETVVGSAKSPDPAFTVSDVGAALVTVTVSAGSLQSVVTGALWVSPL
jgi:hypothetical protein